MKKSLWRIAVIALIAGFTYSCSESLLEEQNTEDLELKSAQQAKESYIVLLEDGELNLEVNSLNGYQKKKEAMAKASERVLKRAGVLDAEIGFVYGTAVKGFSVKLPPGQLQKLQDDPSVKLIEKDRVIQFIEPQGKPGETGKPSKGGSSNDPVQTTPWGITRVGGAVDGTGKTAWIIDSGIDMDHPELNVDQNRSVSFLGGRDTSPDDQNGHGTHVAGTIAAKNNSTGVVGVAAGATVVSVRVLDRRGSGSYSGVIAGVDYVAEYGKNGEVANMSLGGPASSTLDQAILNAAAKGIKFALAAGNESDDASKYSPARVNGQNIYTISAFRQIDTWAYFSNYGSPVDYCAPGYSILSTWKDGGYNTISGTSMAAPHVAGILLMGSISTDGFVSGDPDGKADPIAHH